MAVPPGHQAQPPPGFEDQLRGLNLNTGAPPGLDGQASANANAPSPAFSNASTYDNEADGGFSGAKRGSKKRLNQAQRREMSAQLSIPVDIRGPTQQPMSNHQNQGQHHGSPGSWDRGRGMHMAQRGGHGQQGFNGHNQNQGFNSNRQSYGRGQNHSYHSPSQRFSQPQQHHNSTHGSQQHHGGQGFRGGHVGRGGYGGGGQQRQLYQDQPQQQAHQNVPAQSALLRDLCEKALSKSEIEFSEIAENETFRQRIERICAVAIATHEIQHGGNLHFHPGSVRLQCFGSLASGFATKASDMDLGLFSPDSPIAPDDPTSPIPRILEKALLDAGVGARLLTKTRVPIIKICEKPTSELYEALVKERQKYEDGENDHGHAEDEEAKAEPSADAKVDSGKTEEDNSSSPDATKVDSSEGKHNGTTKNDIGSEYYFYVPTAEVGGKTSLYLKQGSTQTLAGYYGVAKRLLAKLSVRDVKAANCREIHDREWEILRLVCQAFINGLEDSALKSHLQSYSSMDFEPVSHAPGSQGQIKLRYSLFAVYTQAECQELIQRWKNWQAQKAAIDPVAAHEWESAEVQGIRRDWERLMNFKMGRAEPVAYNNDLQEAHARMNRCASFELVSLAQGPQESATFYLNRTKTLAGRFPNVDWRSSKDLLGQYIAGIHSAAIQKAVDIARDASPQWGLQTFGLQHQALQLALEYEEALKAHQYEDEHVGVIKTYVDFLRQPLAEQTLPNGQICWALPTEQLDLELLNLIKRLGAPTAATTSKPRSSDKLDFPKDGVGVQCDLNFSAHLAMHNTLLLKCYAATDPRVQPMVLFVKHWAKVRGINSGYRGTLSSYGYVLMVLHYLVNVARPFVCPNLQILAQPPPHGATPQQVKDMTECKGYDVRFWRNDAEIRHLAAQGQITMNDQPIGFLLRGFFEYYSQKFMSDGRGKGFDWGREVLSLRSQNGILSKQMKGWTGAKTTREGPVPAAPQPQQQLLQDPAIVSQTIAQTHEVPQAAPVGEIKEVRHRYLFAIEDPFEVDHNVARTVTHNGIVAIRDEFRRACKIIRCAGITQPEGAPPVEDLLEEKEKAEVPDAEAFMKLLKELHGV